jgi:hypothetical protein
MENNPHDWRIEQVKTLTSPCIVQAAATMCSGILTAAKYASRNIDPSRRSMLKILSALSTPAREMKND